MEISSNSDRTSKYNISILLLTIFIDGLGIGIVFPVITPIILSGANKIVTLGLVNLSKELLLAIIFAIYPAGMFFGASLLGSLSDKLGRKQSLLISLFGNSLGFLGLCLAIIDNNIWLILLSRVISGITAGSVPIAQAAIVDQTSDQATRLIKLGYTSLAYSLGFTLGPLLGSLAGNNSSIIFITLPFIIAFIFCLFNFIFLYNYYHENIIFDKKLKLRILAYISLFSLIIAMLLFSISTQLAYMLLTIFVIANCLAFTYVSILSCLSNIVPDEQQGQIMGIAGSLAALAWAFSPFITEFLIKYSLSLPIFSSALLYAITLIIMLYNKN